MNNTKTIFVVLYLSLIALCYGSSTCFPLTQGWGQGPNGMPRDQWWCNTFDSFLGFSYPVEDDDCGDYSYQGFKNDFQKQKQMYNATFVRIYLPTCRQTSFWVEMITAARDTSMALIPMIFWDWQENNPVMTAAENAFMGVFSDPTVGSIATYIVHSVAFGDELGEQGNYWLNPMSQFKAKLAKYGIPITISDDWDRSVYQNGKGGLTTFGQQVNNISDLTQAHIQPYYHPSVVMNATYMWPYFSSQMKSLTANNKHPVIISQTMWAYNKNGHQRGEYDQYDNMANYQLYWDTINNNCATFKSLQIGWFFHTWFGEPGFDIIGNNGNPVFNWKPVFC